MQNPGYVPGSVTAKHKRNSSCFPSGEADYINPRSATGFNVPVFFCRVLFGFLAASLAIARIPGCWAAGRSRATSGGTISLARYQRLIAPTSGNVRFAKALDRSVTGSINELVKFATLWLEEGEISPHDVGFKLNDILLSALGHRKADGYGKPKEAFTSLMEDLELPGGE
jgi:hypothetical protein